MRHMNGCCSCGTFHTDCACVIRDQWSEKALWSSFAVQFGEGGMFVTFSSGFRPDDPPHDLGYPVSRPKVIHKVQIQLRQKTLSFKLSALTEHLEGCLWIFVVLFPSCTTSHCCFLNDRYEGVLKAMTIIARDVLTTGTIVLYILLIKKHLGIANILNISLWEYVELILQRTIWCVKAMFFSYPHTLKTSK